jgi:nicotinamidase-related amidase
MKRCMVALDVQEHFKPSQGLVHNINQMVSQMPTVATLFKHDEEMIPLTKLGRNAPAADNCLVETSNVHYKHGYTLPKEVLTWLKEQGADEVLLTGGHTDANVLAAGFSLFDAGFIPIIVPLLCYGNDWYMHTVTTGIWAQELGKVFESTAEMKFSAI